MAINFPNNPAVNDTFTVGGTTFTFTGVKWETSAVVEISSDTTPSLGGTLDAGTHNINNVGVITATTFSGNVTGNASGTSGGLSGTPNITVGTVTGTDATFSGNLTVQGTTTTIDTAVTAVDSLNVEGNVGIGTDNPATKLNVIGDTRIEGFSNAKIQIKRTGNTVANGSIEFLGSDNSFGWGLIANNDAGGSNFNIKEGSVSRLYIKSGNVGINSTIPTSQLDVNGNITSSGTVKTGTINTTTAGGAGSNLSGDGRLTLQFPSGGGGGVGMFSVYSGTSKNIEFLSGGSATFAGTISDSIGQLRRLDIVSSSVDLTLSAASHAGRLIRMTSTNRTFTIPSGSFSSGDMITIFHVGTGNMTIAQGSSVTLYNAADGATGNRTLAAKGMVTIACTDGASNEFVISGSQLT